MPLAVEGLSAADPRRVLLVPLPDGARHINRDTLWPMFTGGR